MSLTDAERAKFATWLEQDAESTRLILVELERLPSMVTSGVVAQYEQEMAAQKVVAKKLRSMVSF